MSIKDFFETYVYSLSNKRGVSRRVAPKNFIGLVMMGMANLYYIDDGRQATKHSWQIKKQAFKTTKKPLKIQTDYPILDVVGFWCAKMPPNDYFKEGPCDCPPNFCSTTCE